MSELEAEWTRRLAEAERQARSAGRSDIAEYVALRLANDTARTAGVEWLLATFTALAGEQNRAGASIQIERHDAHRFRIGNSTMVGTLLTLRAGVRAVTVAAGWPRAPEDGFVRGGGLAHASISHFGNRAAGEDLLLVRSENGAPRWVALEATKARVQLSEDGLRRHLARLFV